MYGGTYCFIMTALISSMGKIVTCQTTGDEMLSLGVGIAARSSEFPYLCTVTHRRKWVGACSILSSEFVMVSVSNMNKLIKWRNPDKSNKRYYSELAALRVYAGSIYMMPINLGIPVNSIAGLQERLVDAFYVAYDHNNLNTFKMIRPPEDGVFNLSSILKFDVVDAAFNVGFLKVAPFQWSSIVKPVPLASLAIESTAARGKIDKLERFPFANSDCKLGAWHYPTERKVFHHVLYIPRKLCKQAYCNYNLNACMTFPNEEYHVCFKSAFWGEPCDNDTGAALFCKFFEGGNIFAILTTAINCGIDNLPSVYTTMEPILQAFEAIGGTYSPPQ